MQEELTPIKLVNKVRAFPAFSMITKEDFLLLFKHMLKTDLLEKTEAGTLIPGLEGEKIAGNYRFLSVFVDPDGYHVKYQQREIGNLYDLPELNEVILLAGKHWKVTEIDLDRKNIYVVPSQGKAKNAWHSGMPDIDDRIVQKMQQVLLYPNEYRYLSDNAKKALEKSYKLSTII